MKQYFNYMNILKFYICIAAVSAIFVSCSEPKFKVSGKIEGAEGKTVVLEKADFHGRWIELDSAKVNTSGKYSIEFASPASPEIYRLSLGGSFIYFPIDSLESLTVNSNAANFASDFEVKGSEQAVKLAEFEKSLMNLNTTDSVKTEGFKRDVFNKYLKEGYGSILSYYVLTKTVNGTPLYDPASKNDAKYYSAVATAFQEFKPDDPHTGMLRQVSLDAMKRKNRDNGQKVVLEAEEITLIDIELPDTEGQKVKLSEIAKQGKPTIVLFSMMNDSQSPALNIAVSELYNKLGGRVNIYNVSFDADQYAWRQAARNLPWTTVIDPAGQTSDALVRYNVGTLPAYFIYDASGSLVDRATDFNDLEKKIASY